jgi:predicted component of type VI protein secretion system
MKTTLDISDALLEKAKSVAAQDGVTLRSLVEQGLQNVLATRHGAKAFKLRDASVKGKGLNPEFADADWATVRDMIYEGRGA